MALSVLQYMIVRFVKELTSDVLHRRKKVDSPLGLGTSSFLLRTLQDIWIWDLRPTGIQACASPPRCVPVYVNRQQPDEVFNMVASG